LIIEQYKRQKDFTINSGTQKQCQKLEQHIQHFDKQIQRLIDAYQTEILTLKELETRKIGLEQKISQLQEQIRNIKIEKKGNLQLHGSEGVASLQFTA
jgi:hypothetical protein